MSGLAMSKPWTRLTDDAIAAMPAQLGVFQIGDADGLVLQIGYGGGREPFGLRSALDAIRIDRPTDKLYFRVELTHSYMTRWEELLMVYKAVHDELPIGNQDHKHRLGTLAVDQSSA